MSLLKVDSLAKSFGGLKVLTDVTFEVKKGQRLALIGPNGAGKSTLINAIGGQSPPSAGKVLLDGHDVTNLSPNRRLHMGLARSFQQNNLFWQPTVLQNILLALYGAEKAHIRLLKVLDKRQDLLKEAERLLRLVGLWEKRNEAPTVISYGEQRLLELLLAFTANPKIVLLDEPSAGLPTAEVSGFIEILRVLSKDTTLLFCAHDLDLVFSLADEIMVLYFGQIIAKGLPKEITNNPKVQEIYLGE